MAARLATVAELPSEFDAVDSRDLTFWLDHAAATINVAAAGEKASLLHAMLTAHYLKRASLGSSTTTGMGVVTSKRVGAVAVTYAAGQGSSTRDYDTTAYGIRYLELLDSIPAFPIAIRSNDLDWPPR